MKGKDWTEYLEEPGKAFEWVDLLRPPEGSELLFWGLKRASLPPLVLLGLICWMRWWPKTSVMPMLVLLGLIGAGLGLCWHCRAESFWVGLNLGLIGFGLAVALPHLVALWT